MVVIDEKGSRQRGPSGYKVAPRNKASLRALADSFRTLPELAACYRNDGCFMDAVHLLENVLYRAGFNLHVLDDSVLPETAAFTIPEQGWIVMRQSVYDGLFRDDPFSRYTVVHEFSHIALEHAITLHRGAVLGQHEWWEDSEWQANNLAAEMMMPVEVVKKLDSKPLLIMSECGVSAKAAHFRLENLKKDGLI